MALGLLTQLRWGWGCKPDAIAMSLDAKDMEVSLLSGAGASPALPRSLPECLLRLSLAVKGPGVFCGGWRGGWQYWAGEGWTLVPKGEIVRVRTHSVWLPAAVREFSAVLPVSVTQLGASSLQIAGSSTGCVFSQYFALPPPAATYVRES